MFLLKPKRKGKKENGHNKTPSQIDICWTLYKWASLHHVWASPVAQTVKRLPEMRETRAHHVWAPWTCYFSSLNDLVIWPRNRLCQALMQLYHTSMAWFSWWLSRLRIRLQCRRLGFDPWVGKIPWKKEWQPTPVCLPGESHGERSLVGYSPRGGKELDTTEGPDWSTFIVLRNEALALGSRSNTPVMKKTCFEFWAWATLYQIIKQCYNTPPSLSNCSLVFLK